MFRMMRPEAIFQTRISFFSQTETTRLIAAMDGGEIRSLISQPSCRGANDSPNQTGFAIPAHIIFRHAELFRNLTGRQRTRLDPGMNKPDMLGHRLRSEFRSHSHLAHPAGAGA